MSAVDEKKLDKKLRLLRSAYELFAKKGVNMTAIDDVVKTAGVAKGTFYLYFKDKHDLIDQVMIGESRTVVHRAIEHLRQRCSENELSPAERLILFYDDIITYLVEHKQLVSLVNKNMSACVSWIMQSTDEAVTADTAVLKQPFIDCGMSEKQARLNLYILSDTISGVCCDAILGSSPYTIDEIRPELYELIKKLVN